jgi:hypothetical protein
VIAVVVGSMLAGAPSPAGAETTTINFDGVPAGTTVNELTGVTFTGGPKTFVPVHVATSSPPNALHTNGSCSGSTCPSGANVLEIKFANPVGSVSWRVGLDDEAAETEFGEAAELVAYDAGGTPVGTSGLVDLGANDYKPITKEVAASSDKVDIVRAVLTVGLGGTPRRVNVDDLVFVDEAVPVPEPVVEITAPANRQEFDRVDDVRVSGRVTAPAGVYRFCLSTGFTPPSFPAECHGSLNPDGTFSNVKVGPLVSGNNYIAAWVEDRRLRRDGASVTIELRRNDLRVTNMEVTQGIQLGLPVPTPDANDVAHTATYNGVPLINNKGTAVRVWTSARLDAAGTPVHGAAVYLYGEHPDGTPLSGSPVPAIEGSRDIGPALSFGPLIEPLTWSNPSRSWTFILPSSWQRTGGPIALRAVVNPPLAFPHVNECTGCEANNTLRLTDLKFRRPHTLDIWPFRVIWRDKSGKLEAPPREPWSTFGTTHKLSPFNLAVHPWQGVLNAQSISEDMSLDGDGKTSAVYDRLTDAVDIAGYPGFLTVAINRGLGPGVTSEHFSWSSFTIRTYAVATDTRPFTSVTHEIYHGIGFEHAGRDCDDAAGRGGAEPWIPDERGLIQGVGADVSSIYSPARSLRLLGFFDAAGNPTEFFDFMSYCAWEDTGWISGLNWFRAIDHVAEHGRASSASASRAAASAPALASAGGTLGVAAQIGESGSGDILRVEPSSGRLSPPSAGSPISIRVRNRAGGIVSETPVLGRRTHVDTGRTGSNVIEVSAVVAAAGAASVELVREGAVLDTVRRSKASPKVRLLAPRAETHVGSRGVLNARWQARDPDSGLLLSGVDFSANGGRSWKAVAVGFPTRSFAIPISLLSRTGNARLRVRVSDGWNETAVTSGRFRVDGPPPAVSIESPPNRARLRADQPLNLEGVAFNDRSQALPDRRLQWFDGRRAIGRGHRLSLLTLRPGKHTIRLLARDGDRTGQDSIRVRVSAVKPAFLVLQAPGSISRKARRVTIRAAASLPGTLSIGGRRFDIDRRTRRFRVPVRPGKSKLKLKLALKAGGGTTRAQLSVARR